MPSATTSPAVPRVGPELGGSKEGGERRRVGGRADLPAVKSLTLRTPRGRRPKSWMWTSPRWRVVGPGAELS